MRDSQTGNTEGLISSKGSPPPSIVSTDQAHHKLIERSRKRIKYSTNIIVGSLSSKFSQSIARSRANHSKGSWEEQRPVIERLYQGEGATVQRLKNEMDQRGFIAT
jgi:hypothetical protein